jgi:hypothetical protein
VTEFDKVIRPGGVGKVTANVTTTQLKGQVSKSITVTTNDPASKQVILQIKATVSVPLDVQPNENVFMQGEIAQIKPSELTVASSDGKPFDILSIDNPTGNFRVTVRPFGSEEAKAATGTGPVASGSAKYAITVAPPEKPTIGRSYGNVTLKTNHPKQDKIEIRVTLNLQGPVKVEPERVYIMAGAGPASGPPSQHVKLKKPAGDALKIEKVESSDPGISATLTTVQDGREYDVEIKHVGESGKGTISGQVKVRTNDPQQGEITIPVVIRT